MKTKNSQIQPKQLFTDYPIIELGDEEFIEAPIRECQLLSYDGDKYCYVTVQGVKKEIKRYYIYLQKGRCGEVDCISVDEIKNLMKESIVEQSNEPLGEFIKKESKSLNETLGIVKGVKWQAERMYSEEEVLNILLTLFSEPEDAVTYLEQFKNRIK
jgi:hypothetical protein